MILDLLKWGVFMFKLDDIIELAKITMSEIPEKFDKPFNKIHIYREKYFGDYHFVLQAVIKQLLL